MDQIENEGASAPKKKSTQNTVPVRVRKATARTIKATLNKLNKRPLGRKVTVDDIVAKALPLLTETHLDEIKESTYSSQDRLEIQYQEYCRVHGNTTKEKFLEELLKAGLPVLKNTSQSDA